MTYAKAFRPASRPLSGHRGSALLAQFCRPGRTRRERILAWLFLSAAHLDTSESAQIIRTLDAQIGVVIRLYDGQTPRFYRPVLALLKAQRRPTLIGSQLGRQKNAFGQHIPQWQRPARRRPRKCLSMSVHNHKEAVRARRAGADLVFVSPLYPTQSHPGAGHLGPIKARALARTAQVPAFALGGIHMGNAAKCSHGFSGFGAISALLLEP